MDVGANVGKYTDQVLEMLPDSRVVGFEPNPDVFQNLNGRFSPDRVTVEMKGLGASDEVLKFYDRQDRRGASAHGSLYREVVEDLHHVDAVEKEITTRVHKICKIHVPRATLEIRGVSAGRCVDNFTSSLRVHLAAQIAAKERW